MRILTVALAAMPGFVFAAGGGSATPPPATQTTTTCTSGQIWDEAQKKCVSAEQSSMNDDARYDAVRELAYAGRIADAQAVLATMSDQTEGRVLTYWGFTHGKQGDLETGLRYYEAALIADPDNILARSYMGQALIAAGQPTAAMLQLAEIRARGGTGSWAETSLRKAVETGVGYSY